MTTAKKKKSSKHPKQKAYETWKKNEYQDETEDLKPVIERRKFSYTIHIPERRAHQNRDTTDNLFQDPAQRKLDYS